MTNAQLNRMLCSQFVLTKVTCDVTFWSCIVVVFTEKPGAVICIWSITTNIQESTGS